MSTTVMSYDSARAAAEAYLAGCNLRLISAAAQRRQRHYGAGERAPAGIARAPVKLQELTQRLRGGKVEPVTTPGTRTAVTQRPRVLAALKEGDPRLHVADMVAAAVERIGSVGGTGTEATATKSIHNDGGATTRVKHAERLRLFEALANGWAVDARHGNTQRGVERVVMAVQRKRGNRQEIKAYPLLVAVCAEGRDLADVLEAHGWKVCSQHTGRLRTALEEILHDMAAAMGYLAPRQKQGS